MTGKLWIARLIACYGAIAAGIPYLTLKLIWLLGYPVGAATERGAAVLLDARHVEGNVLTFGLETVAIALALAFTYRWGQSIPPPPVLVPIWVGIGLLVPIALGIPLGLLAQAFAGGSPSPDTDSQGWVFALVYGGFTAQAVLLGVAFVMYARVRWPEVFRMRTPDLPKGQAYGIQVMLANGAAVPAAAAGVMFMLWAFAGRSLGGPASFETVAQRTFLFVAGILMLVGVIGVLMLVHRRGAGRLLVPVTLAWVGAAVTFSSGLHGDDSTTLTGLVSQAALLSGLLMGVAGLLSLADRKIRPPAETR